LVVWGKLPAPCHLLDLPPKDRAHLIALPPLVRIGTDQERPGVLRQPRENGVAVGATDPGHPPLDNTPDLLGRLHPLESAQAPYNSQGERVVSESFPGLGPQRR